MSNIEYYKFVNQELIPNRLRFNNKFYTIKKIPSNYYVINEFTIVLEERKLKELLIHNCWHPNATENPDGKSTEKESEKPPKIQKFCLPLSLKNLTITENDITSNNLNSIFNSLLKTYNYENSYWIKWKGFLIEENI